MKGVLGITVHWQDVMYACCKTLWGLLTPKGELHTRCVCVCGSMLTNNLTTEVHVSAFHQPILPLPLTTAHCVLQKLPEGERLKDYFIKFQMITKASANHITTTTQNGTALGMYVDIDDGWKVKLTDKSELWDKFTFQRFQPDK